MKLEEFLKKKEKTPLRKNVMLPACFSSNIRLGLNGSLKKKPPKNGKQKDNAAM